MNSTVMPPPVQETMFDFRADQAWKDPHDLIDSLTDYDISRGLRLSFTGYPSFTQTKGADSVEAEINVGTFSKPCKRTGTQPFSKQLHMRQIPGPCYGVFAIRDPERIPDNIQNIFGSCHTVDAVMNPGFCIDEMPGNVSCLC